MPGTEWHQLALELLLGALGAALLAVLVDVAWRVLPHRADGLLGFDLELAQSPRDALVLLERFSDEASRTAPFAVDAALLAEHDHGDGRRTQVRATRFITLGIDHELVERTTWDQRRSRMDSIAVGALAELAMSIVLRERAGGGSTMRYTSARRRRVLLTVDASADSIRDAYAALFEQAGSSAVASAGPIAPRRARIVLQATAELVGVIAVTAYVWRSPAFSLGAGIAWVIARRVARDAVNGSRRRSAVAHATAAVEGF